MITEQIREITPEKILHYMHYETRWFYWFDEYRKKKYYRRHMWDDVIWLPEDIYTKRECKKYLEENFPNIEKMIAYPYHMGFTKIGSRPIKLTIDRKRMLREKNAFKKELLNKN